MAHPLPGCCEHGAALDSWCEDCMGTKKKRGAEQRLDNMLKMMRHQRNEFLTRPAKGGLGTAHSAETRKAMACLLDWYIENYKK